jgi:hypothetical protein
MNFILLGKFNKSVIIKILKQTFFLSSYIFELTTFSMFLNNYFLFTSLMIFESHNSFFLYNKQIKNFSALHYKNVKLKFLYFFYFKKNIKILNYLYNFRYVHVGTDRGRSLLRGYPLNGQRSHTNAITSHRISFNIRAAVRLLKHSPTAEITARRINMIKNILKQKEKLRKKIRMSLKKIKKPQKKKKIKRKKVVKKKKKSL